MKIKEVCKNYSNYIRFKYQETNGDINEYEVVVYALEDTKYKEHNSLYRELSDCTLAAFDINTQAYKKFEYHRIDHFVYSINPASALIKCIWVNTLERLLKGKNLLVETEPTLNETSVIHIRQWKKRFHIEHIGFTDDTALFLDHIIANGRAIETDSATKWIVMNNLTQGFVENTNEGKVRYMNVKEFLELMK